MKLHTPLAAAAVLTLAITACGTTTESGTTASTSDTSTQSAPEVDKAAQRDELTTSLDSWFDGCTWEHQDSEHTARASCAENELGVIVGNTSTQSAPEVYKAAQRDELTTTLDSWFDGCTWEHQDSEHTARASCAENELGVIVGNTSTDVKVVLDGIAESADGGPGGYAVKDNWAVWSTDQGNVNLASDVLSASSGRESF